jgi:60S ribosomal subunit assembly/export protein LOC1
MMTILAMVNADKEGQIESKMIKARHMEEIREARKKEAEARQAQKLSKLASLSTNYPHSALMPSRKKRKTL